MVNVNAKSPLSKRKSSDNAGDLQAGGTPKVAKLNTSLKTPGKGKNFATPGRGKNTPTPGKGKNTPAPGKGKNTPTPGKGKNTPTPGKGKNFASPGKGKNFQTPGKGKNFATPGKEKNVATPGKGQNATTPGKGKNTPETTPKQNNFVKAPQAVTGENVAKTPKTSPIKNQQQNNSMRQNNQKNKRASTSENEGSPPKKQKMIAGAGGVKNEPQQPKGKKPRPQRGQANKLKKFPGTSGLEQAAESKPLIKKEEKVEAKKGKRDKQRKTQFFGLKQKVKAGDKDCLNKLELKIKNLENNKDLSKTAMKKLRQLQKLRDVATGVIKETKPQTVTQKRRERQKDVKAKHVEGESGQNKEVKVVKAEEEKEVKVEANKTEAADSSDYEVDAEITPDMIIKTTGSVEEEDSENVEEDEEEDNENVEEDEEEDNAEEEEDGDNVEEEGDGDNVEEEEENLDDSDEVEVSEEDSNNPAQNLKGKQSQAKAQSGGFQGKTTDKKQSRYVLYVGNLPYDITEEEVSEHFKTAGKVRDIRIPKDRTTNKPRGFAYVEFHDETTYQKGLSLHHTFIKRRRINVLYTQGANKQGEDNKKEVKAKNFKLHAMRKQGQLAGSVRQDQKRSFRRAKQQTPRVNGDS